MILSYETLFVYYSIKEINIAQFGKMTSKTLIFSSPIYTCIFYIFKNLYLLFMNISSWYSFVIMRWMLNAYLYTCIYHIKQ